MVISQGEVWWADLGSQPDQALDIGGPSLSFSVTR